MTERDSITLWEETLAALKENGKEWDNVYWICIGDKRMYKSDFEKHAKKILYKPWNLYGLKFMLIRQEYDGSEWWAFLETEPPGEYTMTDDPRTLFAPRAWKYQWKYRCKDFEKENEQ